MKIPCETIARFSHMLPSANADVDPIFRTMRLENGKIIATDRYFLAVEQLTEKFEGVYHITVDDALLAQCRTESTFSGTVEIIATPPLGFTTAKTTMGYVAPGNIGVYGNAGDYDLWYERVVAPTVEPAAAPQGGMLWRTDDIHRLSQCSPSGEVIFESVIDVMRPTVVRDINSPDWCGFFLPRKHDGLFHAPATLPGWLK